MITQVFWVYVTQFDLQCSCKYVLNIFKHFRENSITISGLGNEKTGKISLNS